MQITVLSVSKTQHMTKANKPYFQLEVAYKGEDGQVKGKKLMPFGSSKPAFDALVAAQSGEAWDISLVKEGEYWTWTAAKKSDGTTSAPSTSSSTPQTTQSSSYQGAKGNMDTQRYIVRQSSLSNAINLKGSKASVDEVIAVAKQFEAFVFGEEPAPPVVAATKVGFTEDNFENDVPL